MRYECIKQFEIEKCDGDGFTTEGFILVEKGTVWNISEEDYRLLGGEVRLENVFAWIEISKEDLKENFVKID